MACLKFVRSAWEGTIGKGGHDGNVLSTLKLTHARPGQLKTSLFVEKRHLNNHQTLHGGVLLSLTDTVTSLALSTLGIPPPTGVSVNITCDFVRPAGREGDELVAVGEVSKLGRTITFTRVSFYDAQQQLVAFGSHTKHMGKAVPTTSFSADGETELAVPSKL
ncbi:hypothetical protein Q5752_002157 [Cryptotrichosporon argae]